jgi:hypothetical protein
MTSPADLPADVSLRELGQLSPRALAGFAARVAERALVLLAKKGPASEFAVLASAVRAASEVAAGEPFADPGLVARAYEAAESLHVQAGFFAFAAAHAARAALYAAGGGPADPDAAFNEIVASSYGATRAVLSSGRTCGPRSPRRPSGPCSVRCEFSRSFGRTLACRRTCVAFFLAVIPRRE